MGLFLAFASVPAAQGIKEAARYRDKIAADLTPEQINEARSLAASWKPMTAEEFEKRNEQNIENLRRHFEH